MKLRVWGLILVCLVFLTALFVLDVYAGGVPCNDDSCIDIWEQDYSGFPKIALKVPIWNSQTGAFVEGLEQQKDAFQLRIDNQVVGAPYAVEQRNGGVTAFLIMDVDIGKQIEVTDFVEEFTSQIFSRSPQSRVSLWSTATGSAAIETLTGDSGAVVNRIKDMQMAQANPDALNSIIADVIAQSGYKNEKLPNPRQVVIILSSTAQLKWKDALSSSKQKHLPIFWILFGSDPKILDECSKIRLEKNGHCALSADSQEISRQISAVQKFGDYYLLRYTLAHTNMYPDLVDHLARLEFQTSTSSVGVDFHLRFPISQNTYPRFAFNETVITIVILILIFLGVFSIGLILSAPKPKKTLHFKPLILISVIGTVLIFMSVCMGGVLVNPQEAPIAFFSPAFYVGPERLPTNTPTPIPGTKSTVIRRPYTLVPTSIPMTTSFPMSTQTFTPTPTLTSSPTPTPILLTGIPPLPSDYWCDPQLQNITDPLDESSVVTGKILPILGTAFLPDDEFSKLELSIQSPGGFEYKTIAVNTEPIPNKKNPSSFVLGGWDLRDQATKGWPIPGWYIIRLRVIKTDGNWLPQGSCYIRVRLIRP